MKLNNSQNPFEFGVLPHAPDNDRKIKSQIVLSAVIVLLLVFNALSLLANLFPGPAKTWDYVNLALNGTATIGCAYSLYLGMRTLKNRYTLKLEFRIRGQLDMQLPEGLNRFRGLSEEHSFFHPYGWNGITKYYVLIDDEGRTHIYRAESVINKIDLALTNIPVDIHLKKLLLRKSKSDLEDIRKIAESLPYDEVVRIIKQKYTWSDDFGLIAVSKYPVLADHYRNEAACRQWAISLLGENAPIFGEGFTLQAQLCGALGALTDLILTRGSADIEMPSAVLQQLVSAQDQQPTEERALTLFRWVKAILDGASVQFGSNDDHDDWFDVCPKYLLANYPRIAAFRAHLFGSKPAYPEVLKDLFCVLLRPWDLRDEWIVLGYTDPMIKGYHLIYGFESAMQLFPDKTRLFLENDLDL